MGKPPGRDAQTLVQWMDQHGKQGGGSGSTGTKWTGLVVLIAIVIAVPVGLILVYKKWLARPEEE